MSQAALDAYLDWIGFDAGWRAQLAEVAAVTITVLNVEVVVLEGKASPNMLLVMSFFALSRLARKRCDGAVQRFPVRF